MTWPDGDQIAALEWQAWKDSLCSCGLPRHETFDPRTDDKFDVEVLQCHACAARERKAWNRAQGREAGSPPPFGEFFAVTGPHFDE